MTDHAAVLAGAARPARAGAGHPARRALPAVLAAAGILAQIGYPLTDGPALHALTILTVVLLAAAAVTHAALTRGLAAAGTLVVVAGGIGLLAEAAGVATGVPFGEYGYAGTLGPKLLGVPVIVPLAWTMLAYPCLLLGRRLAGQLGQARQPAAVVAAGGLALAAWDLFLDPQMVAEGHWTWRFPEPALPGVPGVPLTNYAGWVLVALVMIAALHRTLPRGRTAPRDEAVPAAVLAWTWAGSALGNVAFFGRPWVALWGGVAMGALVVPYLLALRRSARG